MTLGKSGSGHLVLWHSAISRLARAGTVHFERVEPQECVAGNAELSISHAVQLEQWLMEGAYNKVLEARPQLPHQAYSYFMEKLLSTVRYKFYLPCT